MFRTIMKMCLAMLLLVTMPAFAQDKGTADEAVAMAKRAAAALKADRQKAIAAINDKDNKDFHYKDLYVFVGPKAGGALVAHGVNPALMGRDLENLKDVDGKPFVAEMRKVANEKGEGWVDYKWTNPVSKKIELKSTYVLAVDDLYLGVGIYK